MRAIATGEFDTGYLDLVEASGLATYRADEVDMVIVMVPFLAIITTYGITRGVVSGRDHMNDALFQEGLEGPIYRHPIQLVAGGGFDITMRQPFTAAQEDLENAAAHPGHAEAMAFQYGLYLVLHDLVILL